jgi:hypothetical protein
MSIGTKWPFPDRFLLDRSVLPVNKPMRNHLVTSMAMRAPNRFTQTIQGKCEGIQRFNIRVKPIHRPVSKVKRERDFINPRKNFN